DDVVRKVGVDPGTSKNADRTRRPFRVVAGIFKRAPGELKQDALLRVHDLRFSRRVAEERSIEVFGALQNAAGAHTGPAQTLARNTCGDNVVLAKFREALLAGA